MKEKKLIRVTAVLDYVESKWKEYWWRKVGFEAADKISRESASFGTEVHTLIGECLINKARIITTQPKDQCADTVLQWLEEHNVKPYFGSYKDSLEIEVKDEKLGLVGHFDYAAIMNGTPVIIDFKTSNKMRKSFPLQKAAYAYMTEVKETGADIDTGITIRSHWNKETQKVDFEVKTYEELMKKYWPKFKAALDTYKYYNGKD